MPHIFTNAEYFDMMYVYGFCDCSATAAVEVCRRRFPMRRIPDRRVFYRAFNTLGVWRTSHEDGLYLFHSQSVQNLHSEDSAMRLVFCHWLHTNRQLLPLILRTDEATFTRNGINNKRNSHQWSHENPHGTVETNFQRRFSINVRCGMIDDMLIGPVILDDRVTGHN